MQKQATIPISNGARIPCAAISSDGKWLAWVEEMPNKTNALWVGHIDGTGKREIGALTARTPKSDTYVTDLQWLPDNQHLSFVHADTLYTVDSK